MRGSAGCSKIQCFSRCFVGHRFLMFQTLPRIHIIYKSECTRTCYWKSTTTLQHPNLPANYLSAPMGVHFHGVFLLRKEKLITILFQAGFFLQMSTCCMSFCWSRNTRVTRTVPNVRTTRHLDKRTFMWRRGGGHVEVLVGPYQL